MAAETVTFASVKAQLASRKPAPVYLLQGEEGYFIDALLKEAENLVDPADRDFNLYTFYAPQVDAVTVAEACRRYPMMADYQVVLVKEAQSVTANWLKALKPYVENLSASTVLVIASRGAACKSTELTRAIQKAGGVVFESKKLKDTALAGAIADFVKSKGLSVDPKALSMLRDYVGSDLSRIYNEVDKLTVTLGPGAMITPEAVERNIGFSKDFNNFELVAAIAARDADKALIITDYFRRNPKNNPTPVTATVLANYFSNMLTCFYSDDKGERALMALCGFKWPGQLADINRGMRNYTPAQAVEILSAIREFDAMSKGCGSRMDPYDLLTALMFRILTARGSV